MSTDDKTDDQSGSYNVPAEKVEHGSDLVSVSSHASSMSAPTAWFERRRLEQIAKTQAQHKKVIEQKIDLNISLGDLAQSELYRAAAIDELHDLPNHVLRARDRRKKEEELEDVQQETELTKAKRKLREQQQKLVDLDGDDAPREETANTKKESAQIIINARIYTLKEEIHTEIECAKKAGYYSESYEENLYGELDEQIEILRKEYLS